MKIFNRILSLCIVSGIMYYAGSNFAILPNKQSQENEVSYIGKLNDDEHIFNLLENFKNNFNNTIIKNTSQTHNEIFFERTFHN